MKDSTLDQAEVYEELTPEQEQAIDETLQQLAMDTLNFLNDRVTQNPIVPPGERPYLMLSACDAIRYNIIEHIARLTGASAADIAERTHANLMSAIEADGGHEHHEGCGHDHTH